MKYGQIDKNMKFVLLPLLYNFQSNFSINIKFTATLTESEKM